MEGGDSNFLNLTCGFNGHNHANSVAQFSSENLSRFNVGDRACACGSESGKNKESVHVNL